MRWAAIRAGLIAVAIFLGLVDGLPIPAGHERPKMEQRLTPGLVKAVDAIGEVRVEILEPFRPLTELTYVRQRWKLFAGASRKRWRMRIDARTGPAAEWELVYRVLDDDHDFMASTLEYRRVRGAWNPHSSRGPRGGYHSFCQWVGRRVLAAFPAYTEVRVQHERIRIGPRGGYRETGELHYPVVVRRPPPGQP
jgi:hypothetical protein